MTLHELFARIAPAKLASLDEERVAEALHDGDATDAPLFVRLFTAIGTWIGAAMMAVLFVALHIHEVVLFALLLAGGLFYTAFVLARRPIRSLALTQLIWAMTLASQGLVASAVGELEPEEPMAGIGIVVELATMFLIRVPSLQLISAVCAVGFATWFAALLELSNFPLWVVVPTAGVATAAWILEVPWAVRLGRTWSAIAYGLPIGAALVLATMSGFSDDPELDIRGLDPTIATLAILVLIGVVLARAKQEHEGAIETRAYLLGGLVLVGALAARHMPGLSLALLWLLIAHLRRAKPLEMLAMIQLAGFLFLFYYQLETTLLLKSLWVISTGAVLLLGAWLARMARSSSDPTDRPKRTSRWLPAIGLALLTSALVIGASMTKQRIVDTGETLLLPLMPVDPRSLIQGDYMQLRYALEQDLPIDLPRHGTVVIRVDAQGVGQFARVDDGRPLAADERRLEVRMRSGNLRIGAEEYFFEEGSADLYAGARYGELALADDGEVVLIGLRDADRQPLGVRLHPR